MKLTPAMKQYMEIKSKNRDSIVFFRMGDFYETFFEDAKTASKELGITLTTRGIRNSGQKIPLAGIPYHAVDSYLPKLIKKGYKVAIVEQLEDPAKAKGIVKRGVIRIVTPGTILDSKLLGQENNYLASLAFDDDKVGLAMIDISTGEMIYSVSDNLSQALEDVRCSMPSEIILPLSFEGSGRYDKIAKIGCPIHFQDDTDFFISSAIELAEANIPSFASQGIKNQKIAISAIGGLFGYIKATQKRYPANISRISRLRSGDTMLLDETTLSNLEIIHNSYDHSKDNSLFSVLDNTCTPMGTRFLRSNLISPSQRIEVIQARLDAVASLQKDLMRLGEIRGSLKGIIDLERIGSRISFGSVTPRDLVGLRTSLEELPMLKELLKDIETDEIRSFCKDVSFREITDLISESILEEPSLSINDGNIIRKGYSDELDDLKTIASDAKSFLKELEHREKERTGIKSLKIRYNKVFGYYIEVTKPNLHLVPDDFIKKQTLVNSERFITEALKEKEGIILSSHDKIKALEKELFLAVVAKIEEHLKEIQIAAQDIGKLDFLSSLAYIASMNSYCRPVLNEGFKTTIRGARHPVVERITDFVPNDISIAKENRTMILTGPNMAGKSVYMRQFAIITLMSQIGSFVPADSADISIVDRIFSRVGASDDISRGQSTFMMEMTETAQILNQATSRSLVILDEIGRGTSTFDGVSLAWSVAEYLTEKIRAKTIFATHYHVLNSMEGRIEGVKNYNIAVKEEGDSVIFLRKVEKGGTDKSYGIHVARLAGLPDPVIDRAKEIQYRLSSQDEMSDRIVIEKKQEGRGKVVLRKAFQMSLDEVFSKRSHDE